MSDKFSKMSTFYQDKNGLWQKKECTFKILSSKNGKNSTLVEKKFDLATCMGSGRSFQLDMGKGFAIEMFMKI